MGVGGKFWDMLKPYARNEGFDFLRDKRVAVDLSFWIVQHETALKSFARKPHLRLIFFRTINLFAKFGAYPVFVKDGRPSPLKSRARLARFYRNSGVDLSSFPDSEEGVSVERNTVFTKLVQECVELLELFGMPVLQANGEAEALCAQLNREGHVHACITSDSDAFLFGATCVIKALRPNTKEPFECYYMSDIEAGLGLKRNQLIAVGLLAGNDHDLNGVPGIGPETAVRFVQTFGKDEIIDRLFEMDNVESSFRRDVESVNELEQSLEGIMAKKKRSHCSYCGHPGSKRDHLKNSCGNCSVVTEGGCQEKPEGFKCDCMSCDSARKEKERKKTECWITKVCTKISTEPNFPNAEIVEMYLRDNHGSFAGSDGPHILWESPKTELIIDFLTYHQRWEPSYIRQRILPMMSTIFLREMSVRPVETLMYGQYNFDSIARVKIRYGHKFYVVKWKKAVPAMAGSCFQTRPSEGSDSQRDVIDTDEAIDLLNEVDVPQVHVDNGCHVLLTDENCELVHAAFPEEADKFLREKELKESKRRKIPSPKSDGTKAESGTPKSKGVQLNITEFYRSTKIGREEDSVKDLICNRIEGSSKGKRKVSSPNLLKSVKRRLLFD